MFANVIRRKARAAACASAGLAIEFPTMKRIHVDQFRVPPDRRIRLDKWPTHVKPFYSSKSDYKDRLVDHVDRLQAIQEKLYASNSYALLLIFQAMDAAGKDGVIRNVMSGVNPQ